MWRRPSGPGRSLAARSQLIDTKEVKPLAVAIDEINRGLLTYTREEEEV